MSRISGAGWSAGSGAGVFSLSLDGGAGGPVGMRRGWPEADHGGKRLSRLALFSGILAIASIITALALLIAFVPGAGEAFAASVRVLIAVGLLWMFGGLRWLVPFVLYFAIVLNRTGRGRPGKDTGNH